MRRSIRTPLALAAVTAAATAALIAPATAAGAASAPGAQTPVVKPSVRLWGPYFSANGKARATGTIQRYWTSDHTDVLRVRGRLWDLDYRTLWQGGKCAYVQFQVKYLGEPPVWKQAAAYKLCDAGKYREIDFTRYGVLKLRIRVSQIGLYDNKVVDRGVWRTFTF